MDNREPELPILLYSVMGGDFQRQTPNPLDSLIWALPASEGRLGSKLMVTKVLPEGPVAPLEEAPLKGLIQRALRAGLRLAAADLARQSCRREFTFTAICPIIGLNLSDRAFLAESGVNLSSWSNDDRAIFLTRYHQEYLADDMAPWFSNAKITIDATCSISDETAENLVVSALDRLKWAITLGADSEGQYEEGAVILRGIGGWRGRAIRRSDTLLRSRTLPTIEIDSEVAQTVQRFVTSLACMVQP